MYPRRYHEAGSPREHTGDMTDRAAEGPSIAARDERDIGGDPACWLNRVCDACGRFVDDPFVDVCPTCGAPRNDPDQ